MSWRCFPLCSLFPYQALRCNKFSMTRRSWSLSLVLSVQLLPVLAVNRSRVVFIAITLALLETWMSSGQQVRLVLQVRRFRCQNRLCQQQTFVEQVPEVVARSARRTTRLSVTMKLFAGGLSGQLGSYLLSRIGIPVSPDTLFSYPWFGSLRIDIKDGTTIDITSFTEVSF
jgi:hypothetical protein